MGAAQILAANKDKWRGTVMAVFQPGEEIGEGAKAMVDGGMVKRFPKPVVTLGQHVLPFPAGQVRLAPGPVLSRSDRPRPPNAILWLPAVQSELSADRPNLTRRMSDAICVNISLVSTV